MKNKKQTPSQKKVAEVMHEFKKDELRIGTSEAIVTNPKQAIVIALSEADRLDKTSKS